jgi:hypothetical protein
MIPNPRKAMRGLLIKSIGQIIFRCAAEFQINAAGWPGSSLPSATESSTTFTAGGQIWRERSAAFTPLP